MKLVSTLIFLCFAAFLLSSSPTFPILASAQDPVCGKDAGGAYCPNNLCCSNSGQCGTTVEYCGPDNCQLNCRQCGVQTGGALSCNEGFCCSNEGFCGNTEYWCDSDHCQNQCWNSPNLTAIATAVCGKDAGGAYCPNNLCCSNSGQCGTTVEYCGPDNCQLNCRQCGVQTGGALSCNEGFCCSNEGFCGTTEHWCDSGHCQSQCWNSPPPPPTPPPPPPPAATAVCGKDAGGAYCPNNLCCSNSGQCGTTVEYCGPDNCQLNCRQCGVQTGGALSCNEGFCCSNEGFCGNTEYWCDSDHCQSQCWNSPNLTAIAQTNGDISSIITRSVFEEMLKHRNDFRCQSKGFYSYKAFITAARSFQGFGTTGSIVTRKKELAAFFAQTSALTKGGWPGAPDGLHAWGYCYIKAGGSQAKYYGRGPMQLTHKSMYGLAGQALGIDLIENPNLVATDPVVSFKTAIWFWMTPQKDQPSCHDVITNKWEPSDSDLAAGRVPGYGLITNIINGEDECGRSPNANAADRVQFYKRYCDLLNVNYGDNLDCYHQRPFPKIAMVNDM
ncbi:hypothetical protein UlMin_037692 [Ulmus minor]